MSLRHESRAARRDARHESEAVPCPSAAPRRKHRWRTAKGRRRFYRFLSIPLYRVHGKPFSTSFFSFKIALKSLTVQLYPPGPPPARYVSRLCPLQRTHAVVSCAQCPAAGQVGCSPRTGRVSQTRERPVGSRSARPTRPTALTLYPR